MEWGKEDPRETYDNAKQLRIVIYSRMHDVAFTGTVETHHSWSVWTNHPTFNDYKLIGPDAKWPEDWFWIKGPHIDED